MTYAAGRRIRDYNGKFWMLHPLPRLVRRLSGFGASALHVYKAAGRNGLSGSSHIGTRLLDEGGHAYRCKVILTARTAMR